MGVHATATRRYGGVETPHLVLPANTLIRLHVTSLDVVHSFWAYQLGVKADANPGEDNVVYVETKGPRSFDIHCAELCGLWHGYMFDTGQVVPQGDFDSLDQAAAGVLRAGHEVPAGLLDHLPPRPAAPRRLSRPGEEGARERNRDRRPPARLAAPGRLQRAHAALVLGVGGYYLGWFVGHHLNAVSLGYFADTDQNDVSVFLGYIFGVDRLPRRARLRQLPARPAARLPAVAAREGDRGEPAATSASAPTTRSSASSTWWGIGLFFFIGGLNAMLIRVELLRPNAQVFPAGQYLTLVGMHGTMMMGMMSSGILGPFANYFVPLMIGARRMAFPRIEALTFWLLMAAGAILTTTIFFGGFPTGWTGYQPLNDQANAGMDSYIVFFALVGLSMTLLGLNMIATIVTMRAPGLTWSRLPIFCWGVLSTAVLMLLAAPVLIAVLVDGRARPHRADHLLHPERRRQPVPVREPVLGLRAPGGLHPRPARLRDRARAPAGLRAQAALGLPARGRRDARRHAAQLARLAAPPVRQRDQQRPAALLHALDRADLDPDRLHVPLRADDALARDGSASPCRCCSAWRGSSTS